MIHKFTVEIEMAVRDGITKEQAEDTLCDLIDHGMIYSLGMDHVKDDGYPYIFDYDVRSE